MTAFNPAGFLKLSQEWQIKENNKKEKWQLLHKTQLNMSKLKGITLFIMQLSNPAIQTTFSED